MISDPVRGNARRHGSQYLHEVRLSPWDAADYERLVADTAGHKVFSFQSNGKDYDLIYRTRARSSSSSKIEDSLFCFSKDDKKFIPVRTSADHYLSSMLAGGFSAMCNVGRYVFAAGNTTKPTWNGTDQLAATSAYTVAWVRGGAYSRKYRITLTGPTMAPVTVEHTTPPSSYGVLLDTSDIPANIPKPGGTPGGTIPNPEYQKLVNDRVNAYNAKVTAYIGEAAAAIVPSAIADKLIAQLAGAGVSGYRVDSTICIGDARFTEITVGDGGDGTLFRGVGLEVPSIDMVSAVHAVGKVVKVRPKKNDGSDVFYLKAYPRVNGANGWTEVTWREAAGYTVQPDWFCAMGTIARDAGGEYFGMGGNATFLATVVPGSHPTLVPSGVGDRTSSPVPTFFNRRIDYLGMFQDRLIVGSGAVLYLSRTGDYQNFFRQSVLTIDDGDPIEMFALGAEDDTIKASTTYDRNLLIFGTRKQYVISGRVPITPRNASIVVQSAHEDAVDSFPINSGNYVFYNKFRNNTASTHQIQIGQLQDTPESYEISKQLDRYLIGRPCELVAVTSPNMVFLRTEGKRDRLYTYGYLDTAQGGERLFDSWSTWQTAGHIGAWVGVSRHEGDILGYTVRRGKSSTGQEGIYIVADKFVLDTQPSDYPYLDSHRPYADVLRPDSSLSPQTLGAADNAAIAFDKTAPEYMLGMNLGRMDEMLAQYPSIATAGRVGWQFPAYFSPTNPYIRDSNGKAITTGRLTLTKFVVSVADTGGMVATMLTKFSSSTPLDFTGRRVGSVTNRVGLAPITTTELTVPIGREVRDFTYTLNARQWLPLTVTAIEWTGQYFNHTQRR